MAVRKTSSTTKSSTAAKKTKATASKTAKAAPKAVKKPVAVKQPADNRVFISNDDAYWFGNGTHYQIYKKLGAHPSEENGEKGIFFAVWAPNAKAVHVVGTFNGWNEEQHPMNKFNADTLNKQLKQQQNITLQEFSHKTQEERQQIERFSRMERMQVPPIDFYQLKVSYETMIVDEANDPAKRLQEEKMLAQANMALIHQQDLEGKLLATYEQKDTEETTVSFGWWLHQIVKESFGMVTVSDLKTCEKELRDIFAQITTNIDGNTIENKKFDHQHIRSLIRQAFAPIRDFKVTEEVVPCKASLLQIEKLTSPVDDDGRYYPAQEEVHKIKEWDDNPPKTEITEEVKKLLEQLKALGQDVSKLMPQQDPHPERNQTYHYLPYRFDSSLEKDYFSTEIIPLIKDKNLEIYFNGDDTLTEFKINCYNKVGGQWRYIGRYVPDFLLLGRNAEKQIDKVIIIETKGEGFAAKFADKRKFMETEFVKKNNEKFGYRRFEFLYLEDTMNAEQRRQKTLQTIKDFFNL